jgi:hypothetical protein
MQTQTVTASSALAPAVDSRSTPAAQPLFQRYWPLAMIALGLGLTLVWVSFLGYGLVRLIELI